MNTLPEATIASFEDHGTVSRTIDIGVQDVGDVMDSLAAISIDMNDVGHILEDQGVASFHESFADLLDTLTTKSRQLPRRCRWTGLAQQCSGSSPSSRSWSLTR